jgi:predicted xylose isomerase-like sugar epimerase
VKKLKRIMQIENYDERTKQLADYARELGVSITRLVGVKDGKTDENIVWERIQQALIMQQGQKMWIIALLSAIASIVSALAAWVAILQIRA